MDFARLKLHTYPVMDSAYIWLRRESGLFTKSLASGRLSSDCLSMPRYSMEGRSGVGRSVSWQDSIKLPAPVVRTFDASKHNRIPAFVRPMCWMAQYRENGSLPKYLGDSHNLNTLVQRFQITLQFDSQIRNQQQTNRIFLNHGWEMSICEQSA